MVKRKNMFFMLSLFAVVLLFVCCSFSFNRVNTVKATSATDIDITEDFNQAKIVSWADGIKVELDVDVRFWDVGNGSFLVDSTTGGYLLNHITVCGKTINQINTETSSNTYTFTTFPGSSGGRYATAVYVLMTNFGANANRINVYVHKDYFKTLDQFSVGVNSGFYFNDGTNNYKVSKAVEFREVYGTLVNAENFKGEETITASLDKISTAIRPDDSLSIFVQFSKGNYNSTAFIANEVDDPAVFDNIKINGVTATTINVGTNVSSYEWLEPPFSNGAEYQKPVNVYFVGKYMNVRIHAKYLSEVIGNEAVTIELTDGFEVFVPDDGYTYQLSQALSDTVISARHKLIVKDVNGDVIDRVNIEEGKKINLDKYVIQVYEHYEHVGWLVDGSDLVASDVMPESDYVVCPKVAPKVYTVKFMLLGKLLSEQTYTVENLQVSTPAVPAELAHYNTVWENFVLDGGNKVVSLQITSVKEYTVTFKNGDQVVATSKYTVDDNTVTLPEVPTKEGYKGGWENVELNGGDKIVHAVYEPVNEPKTEGGCSSSIDLALGFGISLMVMAMFIVVKKVRKVR